MDNSRAQSRARSRSAWEWSSGLLCMFWLSADEWNEQQNQNIRKNHDCSECRVMRYLKLPIPRVTWVHVIMRSEGDPKFASHLQTSTTCNVPCMPKYYIPSRIAQHRVAGELTRCFIELF